MSALRAKANATSTGSASGTVTYPSRRDTSSTCVFTPPQNPHKSASAVDGPHKNPTYKTALSGTRRHGCYHGLVSPGTPLCRQDRVTLLTAPGAPGRDRPSVNRQVIGSSPIAGAFESGFWPAEMRERGDLRVVLVKPMGPVWCGDFVGILVCCQVACRTACRPERGESCLAARVLAA